MIDIHVHILPGLDDGAKTEADSIAMAKCAIEEGIQTIIATPHHENGVFSNDREKILTHTKILQELLDVKGLDLTVLPGQETRIHGDMVRGLQEKTILPLQDTTYVFVEFASDHVPRYARQLLYDLQVAGYKPIIVHPERNLEIIEHPNLLYDFVRNGALTQVTAGSIVGKFGRKSEQVASQLIEANLTHFIASDAHNTTSRTFYMQDAFERVRDEHGFEVYHMFLENSHLLVDDMTVHRLEPLRIRKKRFFGLF